MSDAQDLKFIENQLKESVKKLQAAESNLKESIRTEEIRLQNLGKIKENKDLIKLVEKEQRLNIKQANIERDESRLEAKSKEIEKRLSELESREQKIVDLNKFEETLYRQRRDFESYRNKILKELDEAKIKTADFLDFERQLIQKEESLVARQKSLDLRDKQYMDRVGELNDLERKIRLETEHLESLRKEREPANV